MMGMKMKMEVEVDRGGGGRRHRSWCVDVSCRGCPDVAPAAHRHIARPPRSAFTSSAVDARDSSTSRGRRPLFNRPPNTDLAS